MKKILIVHEADETEETKKLFYDTLTEAGYEVIYAETGAEAIDVAQQQLPFLIFIGIEISEPAECFRAMREITRNSATKEIPITIVTRTNPHKFRPWAEMPGGKSAITSPYTKEKILMEAQYFE